MPTFKAVQVRAHRRAITDAGLRCFTRSTYADTTMADIVKESGLSLRAVTTEFPTKEDVMREIARTLMRDRIREVDEVTRRRPLLQPADLLRELIITAGLRSQAPKRIYGWSVFLDDPELTGDIHSHSAQQHELVTEYAAVWLESIGHTPEDARLRADSVATVLIGMLHGVLMQMALDPTMSAQRFVDAVRWVDFAPDHEVLARTRHRPSKEG